MQVFAGYVATSEAELETRRGIRPSGGEEVGAGATPHASEFKFLQSQISPHFLFNTLNLLMRTAYREERPRRRISSAIWRICCGGRTTQSDSICTLAEEMQCARQYLTLQSQRLGPGFFLRGGGTFPPAGS